MAESCIVCLGDLIGLGDAGKSPPSPASAGETSVTTERNAPHQTPSRSSIHNDPETIAHLLPCKHKLHHECLKPWVERANSCPICRQNFNRVELKASLTGPSLDSYAVQDKIQTADIDPSMVVDDSDLFGDEPITQTCLICEGHGDEDVLLLCDGCNASCHTYCVGLRSVPAGAWFCQFCEEDGSAHDITNPASNRPRTRRQQRRAASNRSAYPSEWARVWQSVWDRLNLDLDFPFDDEAETAQDEANRRDFEEWQRRFRIAERQGGAARFRDTAATLLDLRNGRNRQPTPSQESQEELRAWNAFDKAQELEAAEAAALTTPPRGNGRNKRKSATPSPSGDGSAPAPPERKLKRPRTRRIQSVADTPNEGSSTSVSRQAIPSPAIATNVTSTTASAATSATTSAAVTTTATDGSGTSTPHSRDTVPNGAAPSFLQSLLQEVEGSASSETRGRTRLPIHTHPNGTRSPARSLSPLSSRSSPPASPRLQSASPLHSPRSQSPPPLTSRIEPIFNQNTQPAFSPASPSIRRQSADQGKDEDILLHSDIKINNGETNKEDHGRKLSYAAKSEIQALVAAALKPAYKCKAITADQYTDVNREVSRRLYESLPGSPITGQSEEAQREEWAATASKEVDLELKKYEVDAKSIDT